VVGRFRLAAAGDSGLHTTTPLTRTIAKYKHTMEGRLAMTIERGLRLIAGVVVLLSVSLAVFSSPYWLLLTAFAGLNLLQSGFTNWCPMIWLLARLGWKPCVATAQVPVRRPSA
jgi:hypothetical protein